MAPRLFHKAHGNMQQLGRRGLWDICQNYENIIMTSKKIIPEFKKINYHCIKRSILQNQLILQKNNYSRDVARVFQRGGGSQTRTPSGDRRLLVQGHVSEKSFSWAFYEH